MESNLLAGALVDAGNYETEAFIAEADVAFGQAVQTGTDPATQVIPWDGGESTDKFAGIAMQSVSGSDIDGRKFKAKNTAIVLRKGRLMVTLSDNADAVKAGDPVGVLEDGLFTKGDWEADAGATKYGVIISNAEFKSAGNPGDNVIVEINLPSPSTVQKIAART